jgi:hypothetical protein
MPLPIIAAALALLAVALRYIIMAAVQLGLWTLIEKYGLPLLQKAIAGIAQAAGVPEEDAKDLAANELLEAFAAVGLFAATLRTKLPLKVVDYLGFTTKGWSKRKLSPKLAEKVGIETVAKTTAAEAVSGNATKVAETVAIAKGAVSKLVVPFYLQVIAVIGLSNSIYLNFINTIDFGNWEGAYQGRFQKILGIIGLAPDSAMPKANTISPDIWKRIYATIEELNPQTIAFPWQDVVKPYSRANLADAVDHFSANIAASGGQATFKNVWGLLLPNITIKPGGTSTSAAASLPAAGAGASTYVPVKVFTGIVTSGTLGSTQPFSVKEDDLINSAQELRDVAQTNAAAFLAVLPGKVVYEIKVVNSVIAADGSKRVGATVQVPNGVTSSGKQKYKYVNNKFAVMSLYLVKKEGTRTKITDITLGPTDVARFNPAASELAGIGNNLVQTVATNKTDDITTIISNTPTATETPVQVLQPLPNYNLQAKEPGDTGYRFYKRAPNSDGKYFYSAIEWAGNVPWGHEPVEEEEYRRATGDTKDYTNSGYKFVNGVITRDYSITPSPLAPGTAAPPMGLGYYSKPQGQKASNLSEYYSMKGLPLPPLAERGRTYQSLGLGSASLYTGTIDQNTKLLIALQGN